MSKQSAKILAIVGSTACGKSDAALKLAEEFDAEILSCDSLLVYEDLNIGTAKPSSDELRRVKHHGINLVSAATPYNAGDFVRYAREVIDGLVQKKKKIIIAGGTGFYLKALICGTWDAPPTQPELRKEFETRDSQELFATLQEKDPDYAAKIQANDRYRVIRALEIIETTGMRLSEQLAHKKPQNPLPYETTILGITRKKPDLEKRIIERSDQMFAKGLVNETKMLLEKFSTVPKALECVGYYEVMQFLKGEMSLPECRERVVISTRQLAKKQMTFFKTFPQKIEWFEFPQQEEEFFNQARSVLG